MRKYYLLFFCLSNAFGISPFSDSSLRKALFSMVTGSGLRCFSISSASFCASAKDWYSAVASTTASRYSGATAMTRMASWRKGVFSRRLACSIFCR